MCDARRAVASLALVALAAQTTGAQDLNKIGARLLAAEHSVNAAHDSIQALAQRERGKEVPYDSIVAGSLTLRFRSKDFTPSAQAMLVRVANKTWIQMHAALGDAADRVVRRAPVVVDQRAWLSRLAPHIIEFHFPGILGRSHAFTTPMSDAQAENAVTDLVGSEAAADEPLALQHYGASWLPAAGLGDLNWNRAAIDLATTNSAVTRDCYAGSITRCKSALGLTEVVDPLVEWYSPADWRVMVSGIHSPPGETAGRRASIDACLSGDAPKECEMLVRERPIPRPLEIDTRHTLIGLALEVGGPKAFDRMTVAAGTPAEILAATSGLGVDDLVARWRLRVLAATPESVRPRVLEATTMIVWILLFGFVAQRKRP